MAPKSREVAIIGSAGRKEDAKRVSGVLFERMCDNARHVIEQHWKLDSSQVTLVSGGSSFADHVAVRLFLLDQLSSNADEKQSASSSSSSSSSASPRPTSAFRVSGLHLHLPCAFVMDAHNPRFEDSGSNSWVTNPGRYLNILHRAFSRHLPRPPGHKEGVAASLVDLFTALSLGAQSTVYKGFHARNAVVARCSYLLAWTWSDTQQPADGGTAHTWKLCKSAHKLHVSLSSLIATDKHATSSASSTAPSETTASEAKAKGAKRKDMNSPSSSSSSSDTLPLDTARSFSPAASPLSPTQPCKRRRCDRCEEEFSET